MGALDADNACDVHIFELLSVLLIRSLEK